MISGLTFAQSLITEIERDLIVSKIIRGNECIEKLNLANAVIEQADSVIDSQNNVIVAQKVIITKHEKIGAFYKENEINLNKIIANERAIGKKYKRKNIGWLIKGVAIGVVGGVLLR